MKKKNIPLRPVWGVYWALVSAVILSACGDKLPEPLEFTDLPGTQGDIQQVVLDHHLDNYFHNTEKKNDVQGKLSFVDVQTRTNTTRLDRIVRFEHPKLCNKSGLNVTRGQTISAGTQLGTMGTTGNSSGVHLHFEVRQDGQTVDPCAVTNVCG